jgi:ABC-type sugar transport system permease subunit
MQNTGLLVITAGLTTIILGVGLAHLTQGEGRIRKFTRGIYLFPQVISLVAVGLIWQFQLNPKYGLVTDVLARLGWDVRDPGITRDPRYAFAAIAAAFVWHALGFFILLFSAGLKQIDQEVTEASTLDGSDGWHRFRTLTWPLLWSVKRTAITYLLIHILTTFAIVYLMTEGGPDRATEVFVSYLYEQIAKNGQYGYASALAVVIFCLSMAASVTVLAIYRRDPTATRRNARQAG